jgi:hypothetical protein
MPLAGAKRIGGEFRLVLISLYNGTRDFRTDLDTASRSFSDRPDQLFCSMSLDDVALYPRSKGIEQVRILVVNRQENSLRARRHLSPVRAADRNQAYRRLRIRLASDSSFGNFESLQLSHRMTRKGS